ncbi:hypothetical protein [Paraburkholderia sp. J67]|uniref:hypothetical protein n=1 Tax=Paraburkholderia sp. J67 TaxID=2805435 RepID=UPI002ABE0063|nr:hypothetical protein [Paraburkholderia sp. J67]
MDGLHSVAYFFGGAFLSNAVPHFVRGVTGQPFQSPFASPPGKGLSSSTVNVVWGFFNLVVAWLLVCHVGDFTLKATGDVAPFGVGMLAMGLFMARHFGSLHGGNR